ncbi:protein ANTAGONIST OF LIKE HETEROCHROMATIN PROTEIN 1 [Aristolochia californica]|uniref:protein ANTAGONIST OF LIKE HETEROCHROMATIN PROTEIN 1 n=1 Tax=Aristolochia californica TaxID=171875 RepID=UPI0035DED8BF
MADDDIVIAMPALFFSPVEKKTRKPSKKKLTEEEIAALIPLVASAASDAYRFLSMNDLFLHPSQALTLESCIKSTALSLSKLHSLIIPDNVSPKTLIPPSVPSSPSCSPSWFRRFLSGATADSEHLWLQYFRVTRHSFTRLLQTLSPHLGPTPDYSLAAALFRLAHAAPYKAVARRFGFDSSSSACRGFHRVVKAIIDHLSHLLRIHSESSLHMEELSLPNCLGALGFHRFFTSEGTLVVQGLVDSDGIFLDVSAGWPGTVSPNVILQHTKLFSRVETDKELLNGSFFELSNGDTVRQYIVGDACCPLLPWLITPFREEDGVEFFSKKVFNSIHGNRMSLVQKAFARVLAQWRLLSDRWKEECLEAFPFVIAAGCLLHNFLIKCGNPPPGEIADFLQEQSFPEFTEENSVEGEALRDALASHLSEVHRGTADSERRLGVVR